MGARAYPPDIEIRKNSILPSVGIRPRLNLIEGAFVNMVVADAPANNEIDITIGATGLLPLTGGVLTGPIQFDVSGAVNPHITTGGGFGPLVLGTAGAPVHAVNAGDVYIGARLEANGPVDITNTLDVTGLTTFSHYVDITAGYYLRIYAGIAVGFGFRSSGAKDQSVIGLAVDGGRQIIFGEYLYINNDFDHPVQTNPTLFRHSAYNPDTNNTRWGADYHTGAATAGAYKIICGSGNIEVYPGGGTDAISTNLRTAGESTQIGDLYVFAAAYALNDVVIYDVAVDSGAITTVVTQSSLRLGVVAAVRDGTNVGIVQTEGIATVTRKNQVGATARGDYVYTTDVAGQVETSAVYVAGAVLGRALSTLAGGGAGTIVIKIEKH